MSEETVVHAEGIIDAPVEAVFELIADPSQHPRWDGNDNLIEAAPGQRVRAVGDVFVMTNTNHLQRQNHVVEFEEGRLIAWKPSPMGERQPGHLWRWEAWPDEGGGTRVRHTYDWTHLDDDTRVARARATTPERLMASITRLKSVAEGAKPQA